MKWNIVENFEKKKIGKTKNRTNEKESPGWRFESVPFSNVMEIKINDACNNIYVILFNLSDYWVSWVDKHSLGC